MTTSARVFLVVAAIAAGILATTLLGPANPGGSANAGIEVYSAATRAALADADTNEVNADGAPQQQVVNGWLARDLAVIQIRQNSALIQQNTVRAEQQTKTNQLLLVLIAVVAVLGVIPRSGAIHDRHGNNGAGATSGVGPPAPPAVRPKLPGSEPARPSRTPPEVPPREGAGASPRTSGNAVRRCPRCSMIIAKAADRCPHCAESTATGGS